MDKDTRPPEDAVPPPGRAADHLVRIFAEKIASGALGEGQPLPPEREIVEAYGVSRTVVREAVRTLANRGLVEARPRFRPVVRRPSFDAAIETMGSLVAQLLAQPEDVHHLFDTRTLVEAGLARQAAVEASKTDIAAMREALETNRRAVDDNDAFFQSDIAFHAVLYGIPGNPILEAVHKAYVTWLAPHWRRMRPDAARNARNYTAHAAIYESILTRDPEAAEAALRAHLDEAWEQVRETFG